MEQAPGKCEDNRKLASGLGWNSEGVTDYRGDDFKDMEGKHLLLLLCVEII